MATFDEYDKAKKELEQGLKIQEMMVQANKIIRSNKNVKEGLVALGFTQQQADKIVEPDFAKRVGFPTYKLTNNNANNKRLAERVAQLEKKVKAQDSGKEEKYEFDGGTIDVNYNDDRVQIFFDSIPDATIRKNLKSNGWRWSPTNKAWQRKVTPQAISNAKYLTGAKAAEGNTATEMVEARVYDSEDIKRRNFSYVSVTAYDAAKDLGIDNSYSKLSATFIVFSPDRATVLETVKKYLAENLPELPANKVKVGIYPQTYVNEAKKALISGQYLPSTSSPEKVLAPMYKAVKTAIETQQGTAVEKEHQKTIDKIATGEIPAEKADKTKPSLELTFDYNNPIKFSDIKVHRRVITGDKEQGTKSLFFEWQGEFYEYRYNKGRGWGFAFINKFSTKHKFENPDTTGGGEEQIYSTSSPSIGTPEGKYIEFSIMKMSPTDKWPEEPAHTASKEIQTIITDTEKQSIKYRDFIDELSELDIWVEHEFPRGNTRHYRKFTFTPEQNKSGVMREITDYGVKETGYQENKNGTISVIISVQNGSIANSLSNLWMKLNPIEEMKTTSQKQEIKMDESKETLGKISKGVIIEFEDWADEVYEKIEELGEITRSDAQGVADAWEKMASGRSLENSFSWGHSPEKTAKEILEKTEAKADNTAITEAQKPVKETHTEIHTSGDFHGLNYEYKNQYALNKAIEGLLKQKGISPSNYSSDEKVFLRKYSGYGGLDKYGPTGAGGLFEYYTPLEVIQKMWALAYKHGYNNGSILEPSVGTGEFFSLAPKTARMVAIELSEWSAKICKILYPLAEVLNQPFEKHFIRNNFTMKNKIEELEKFDLVIGNPPYGDFSIVRSRYMRGMGEKEFTKANNYVEYFLRRSMDLLKPEGVLVFIIGAELKNGGSLWLDSGPSDVKKYLSEQCDLVEAYRLPENIFERTGVTSDIIVLKKK